MILAAGLLVALGLGLFVGGILTGTTVLYWLCVVACGAAGVFLLLARTRMGRAPSGPAVPGHRMPSAPDQRPAAAEPGTGATAVDLPVAGEPGGASAAADPFPAAPAWEPAVPAADATAAPVAELPAVEHPSIEPPSAEPLPRAAHASRGSSGAPDASGEPPVEEVEVTDLLLVVDLRDDVLVVDEHPRYHVAGCRWLTGRETFPLPLDEARTDGFTPCAWCEPDRTLAQRERGRRPGRTT